MGPFLLKDVTQLVVLPVLLFVSTFRTQVILTGPNKINLQPKLIVSFIFTQTTLLKIALSSYTGTSCFEISLSKNVFRRDVNKFL